MGVAHRFGGDWTEQKLEVLAKYLTAYTTVLSKQSFERIYIDAFAGTGSRQSPRREDQAELFPPEFLDGSARIALKTEPRFHRYIFVEESGERCEQLEALKAEFPDRAGGIEVIKGDANKEVQDICGWDWRNCRAALFLDPYGMEVEWATIEAIAATKAIDLWVLFPLGMAVNRVLTRTGDIPETWRRKLDSLLGRTDWSEEFYRIVTIPENLFGDVEERLEKASAKTIGRYFINRLKTVFPGVAEEPVVLLNSKNCPLYLLCFAVGNERGKEIALKIANHLIKDLR